MEKRCDRSGSSCSEGYVPVFEAASSCNRMFGDDIDHQAGAQWSCEFLSGFIGKRKIYRTSIPTNM